MGGGTLQGSRPVGDLDHGDACHLGNGERQASVCLGERSAILSAIMRTAWITKRLQLRSPGGLY